MAVAPPPRPFVLEVCPNVGMLSLTVALPEPPPQSRTGIVAGLVVTRNEAVLAGQSYKFPVPVDPRTLSQAVNGTEVSLRLRLQHQEGVARPSSLVRNKYYDATPLLHTSWLARATELQCAQCQRTLTANLRWDLVRNLPSSVWHEMVECWACHEQAIVMPEAGDLVAEPGQALVGSTFIIVHPDQLLPLNWTTQPFRHHGLTLARERAVAHCHCGSMLGEMHRPSNLSQGIRLFKSQILAVQDSIPWNPQRVLMTSIMAELLDALSSHAAYRVVLVDHQQPRGVLVWVVNWNCRVRTAGYASSHAIKVLYHEEEQKLGNANENEIHIVLPNVQRVIDVLTTNNGHLPSSQQIIVMQDISWRVAYLMQ